MKTTVAFGVLYHTIAILIELSTVGKVFIRALSKIIFIHKVISRVVWRVYVNHLDFAEVGFLQELKHFKVIALNVEVFGSIKVPAAAAAIRLSFTVCTGGICFIITNRA